LSDFLEDLEIHDLKYEDSKKPFHTQVKKSKKDRHSWLKDVIDILVEQGQSRIAKQRAHLAQYRGIQQDLINRSRDVNYRGPRLNRINKFIINHLHDLTETKVSQMAKIKPAVKALPKNDDHMDRESAKVADMVIQHLFELQRVDDKATKLQRGARIFGEMYLDIDWDAAKGDLHPAYVQARDAGLVEDKDQPLMTGDVISKLRYPWRKFLQRKPCFEECEYYFDVDLVPTENLKLDYPKAKNDIKVTDDTMEFDVERMVHRELEETTVVYTFIHKGTKYLPNGYKAVFTNDTILEEGDHPFSHKGFNFIRLTDLDIPDVLNGISKYEMVGPMQNMYDNLSTLLAKNIYLTAHAKWMMPKGAAKLSQLGNDNTVVEFQGSVAPQMAQVKPNPRESYEYRAMIKDEMGTIFGNAHGISRGEIPKGIEASSALQFLNEMETQRSSTEITKHGLMIRDMAKLMVSIAGDKYDMEDGRMVRIVGENNKYSIRSFDVAHLHKSYDFRFDNTSGIPESTSGRHQRILDMAQRSQAFTPERLEELLDISNVEKATTLITESLRAADSENEDIVAGRYVSPPEEEEDHISHWQSHAKFMQSRHYKEDIPVELKAKMKEHTYWTEEAIIHKMATNGEFEAKVATLVNFPLYYHEGYRPARSLQQQAMEAQLGAAQIPGQGLEEIKEDAQARRDK
jgi:hypothetical protein